MVFATFTVNMLLTWFIVIYQHPDHSSQFIHALEWKKILLSKNFAVSRFQKPSFIGVIPIIKKGKNSFTVVYIVDSVKLELMYKNPLKVVIKVASSYYYFYYFYFFYTILTTGPKVTLNFGYIQIIAVLIIQHQLKGLNFYDKCHNLSLLFIILETLEWRKPPDAIPTLSLIVTVVE